MRIIEITDINGHKHQVDADALDAKRFAKDGEKHSFTMLSMDCNNNLFIADADQMNGHEIEYKVTDEMQKRVDDAYQEMCRDLSNAWRGKDYKPNASESADDAYIAACRDLQDAWKRG